ncbi:alpha/beta hydrolase [Nocardia asteroides]|uniref:alpha/beta hydrolase n=1 Tax=Nocardia asteroides TaxID=1824 RepID=UPI0037CB582F
MSTSTTPRTQLSPADQLQRYAAILLGRIPSPILRRLATQPVNTDGEQMAPEIALTMAAAAKAEDFSDLDPVAARSFVERDSAIAADRFPRFHVVEDLQLPGGLAATRYRARRTSRGLVLYFHGGGFVLGSRASFDSPARFLALHADVDVLSVEYRLAPEHPFPAPHEDALVAWDYAVERAASWGVDPHRIVIAGDSAGASIAGVLAQRLRGRELQPALQVLMYPATDLTVRRGSRAEFADSPALTAKQIEWFVDHYLPGVSDFTDSRMSPLLAQDVSHLPPAVVTVAGFDPLRDEGIAYANRLRDSGVPTELIREPGLVHGYISFTAISATSRAATLRVTAAIARALT